MNSPIGSFDWVNVKGALVSGLFMALFAIFANIISAGSIFVLDSRQLIDIGVIAGLTSIVSIMKNFVTDEHGKIAGIKVK